MLNAAAWTHYSYALADACAQLTAPLVEVHISDPQRGRRSSGTPPWSRRSPRTVVAGQGVDGYRRALAALL